MMKRCSDHFVYRDESDALSRDLDLTVVIGGWKSPWTGEAIMFQAGVQARDVQEPAVKKNYTPEEFDLADAMAWVRAIAPMAAHTAKAARQEPPQTLGAKKDW